MCEDFPLRILRVARRKPTPNHIKDDLLGRGVQFPSGVVFLEWNSAAYPEHEQLEHPHVSIYGSINDVEKATRGMVTVEIDESKEGPIAP